MLICPITNTTIKAWGYNVASKNPRISQLFGKNPSMYAQFGMWGHNGIDYGIPVGTPIYAPCDGLIKVTNSGSEGYGLHVKIRSAHGAREVVLGHLSHVDVTDGQKVYVGDKIGASGNTGFSTGPHLHIGMRTLVHAAGSIWGWKVKNYDNGFYGYTNFLPYLINWTRQ